MNSETENRRFLPPEWAQHRATWLSWPHNSDTWPHNLAEAQKEFCDLVEWISKSELACVLVGKQFLEEVQIRFRDLPNVECHLVETNDAWVRDYGPTFTLDHRGESLACVDWAYDAWGQKYPPYDDDQKVANRVSELLQIPRSKVDRVVEGGALEINSTGTLLTTKSCLLNKNRIGTKSPDEAKRELKAFFTDLLGASEVVWFSGADVAGDDTDGHIDQTLRFVDDANLVAASCLDPSDPQAKSLSQLHREAETWIASAGAATELISLPLPKETRICGMRIPASYANFIFTNEHLIVPQFGDKVADDRATGILRDLISNREIVGLPSANLTYGLGSFHCLTQQEPAITDSK